jgi:hypothetical protein
MTQKTSQEINLKFAAFVSRRCQGAITAAHGVQSCSFLSFVSRKKMELSLFFLSLFFSSLTGVVKN